MMMDETNAIFSHGRIVVGTTPVRLQTTRTDFTKGIVLYAEKGNAGDVAIGSHEGITIYEGASDGVPCLRPEMPITLPLADLSSIWLVAEAADCVVHWIAS